MNSNQLWILLAGFVISCNSGPTSKGDALFNAGKYEAAVEAYDDELSENPDVSILYNRGRAYEELGKFDEAMADFERVIRADERNINAYISMAHVHYKLGQYSQALVDAGRALDLNENSPQGHFLEGRCRHQLGYFDAALESYSLALKLNPDLGDAYLYRGALKIQLNRSQSACEDLIKARNLEVEGAEEALGKYCK